MSYSDRHINPAYRQVNPLTIVIPQHHQNHGTGRQQSLIPSMTPHAISADAVWTVRQSLSPVPYATPPPDTGWLRRPSNSYSESYLSSQPQANYMVRHNESPYASPQLSPNPGWMNSSFVPLWTGDNPELYCVTCISRHYHINGSFHTLTLPVPVGFTARRR